MAIAVLWCSSGGPESGEDRLVFLPMMAFTGAVNVKSITYVPAWEGVSALNRSKTSALGVFTRVVSTGSSPIAGTSSIVDEVTVV